MKLSNAGLIFLLLFSNTSHAQSAAAKPFVLGIVDEVQSKELNEKRVLNIYLPEGYNAKDTVKYPVIYLLDGSADEDFIHIAGLVQFNSFSWINGIPKSILVGIANTDRSRDYLFPTTIAHDKKLAPTSGGSAKFIAFIEKELQPFIEKNYRTSTDKTIIGQSSGGLLATEILFEKPALFNRYVIVSPALWWDNASILKKNPAIVQSDLIQTTIYIGVGKEGLTPSEENHVMEVDANLLAEKITNLKKQKNKGLLRLSSAGKHMLHRCTRQCLMLSGFFILQMLKWGNNLSNFNI
jgi:predicted alpha/beta superfamily hydrolase